VIPCDAVRFFGLVERPQRLGSSPIALHEEENWKGPLNKENQIRKLSNAQLIKKNPAKTTHIRVATRERPNRISEQNVLRDT
jgi:hypothetical protein